MGQEFEATGAKSLPCKAGKDPSDIKQTPITSPSGQSHLLQTSISMTECELMILCERSWIPKDYSSVLLPGPKGLRQRATFPGLMPVVP